MNAATPKAGQRVEYRTYTMSYGLSVDDSVGCTERVHGGTVNSISKNGRIIRVRDDASGRVVNVLSHRIVQG